MIEEIGVVVKTEGDTARVAVQKRGACEGCTARGACESTSEGMEIEALNPVHAREGQTVKVLLQAETYLKGSMIVYGLPLVLFIAGAIVGKNIGEAYFADTNSDMFAAIFGFASLIASLIAVKIWSGRLESKAEYRPYIGEIVS
ncbi:MAG: SoxR reducing system RseC family protein [Nitrospiraceae bacterium]|nr:MAG: SoxR reducing system RseC family protein [Nitrospiraceae bacterium]